MRASAVTAIGSATLVLLGCTVGIFLGRWIAAPAVDREPPSADSSAALAEIAELRRTIEEELRSRRAQLQVESRDAGTRVPAVANAGDLDRLTAAVNRLDAALEATRSRAEPVAPSRFMQYQLGKGLGFASIDAMWVRTQEKAGDADPAALVDLNRALNVAHLLWSRDEVLARYGGPSRVEGMNNAGVRLLYDSAASPGCIITFNTTDGFVVSVTFAAPRRNAQANR
jgi:hypothetical protein